jgi:preprotein translocase subunit SecD
MRQTTVARLIVIIVLALISAYIVAPLEKPAFVRNIAFWQDARGRDLQIKQGLDLKGGLQIFMSANLPNGSAPTTAQMETVRRIIDQRVNALGVAEPLVQLQGTAGAEDKILVELPGITDRALAIDLIKQTGQLEFVDTRGAPVPPEGTRITTTFQINRALQFPQTSIGANAIAGEAAAGVYQTAFTGEILFSAEPAVDTTTGRNVVSFRVRPEHASVFQQYTASRIQQPFCIVLDRAVLSCPVIQAALNGEGQITGNFTRDSANQLALTLSYGSLPVPLKLETTRDVGATLGAESVRRSIIAFGIALAALAIFMVLYYRLPGVLSVLSLSFFTLTSLAVFVLLPVTLTLPGIAGFVLSVATAVDSNVLTFERFKEELRAGRSLRAAIEASFTRAWSSIRDSNIAALITCFVLLLFGSVFGASAVRGFAITLGLGILMSLFTAMFVTRTLMRAALGNKPSDYVQTSATALGL